MSMYKEDRVLRYETLLFGRSLPTFLQNGAYNLHFLGRKVSSVSNKQSSSETLGIFCQIAQRSVLFAFCKRNSEKAKTIK